VRPYLEKRAGGVAQGVGPEFKSQYYKTTITRKPQNPKSKLDPWKLEV
jgi:hypothetical protein